MLFIACFIFAAFFCYALCGEGRKDPTKSIVYDIRDITNAPFEKNNTNEIIEFTPKRKKVITIFGCMFFADDYCHYSIGEVNLEFTFLKIFMNF